MPEARATDPAATLDRVFHALADTTRRAMLQSLTQGERKVGELAAPFEMSLVAASKHVRVLEQAGLLEREVRGRTHICRLRPAPLRDAGEWLRFYEQFWSDRLDALAVAIEQDEGSRP